MSDSDSDDSTYCPSEASYPPSEISESDLGGVDKELEGFLFDEDEVSDDEDGEWHEVDFDGDIELRMDDIDKEFMTKMQQQIKVLDTKVKEKKKAFTEEDNERMSDGVKLFNCFAIDEFWSHLLDIANRHRPSNSASITKRELELVTRLILSLGIYGVSLDTAVSHPDVYPLVTDTTESFNG